MFMQTISDLKQTKETWIALITGIQLVIEFAKQINLFQNTGR